MEPVDAGDRERSPRSGYRWLFGDRLPSPSGAVSFSTAAVGALPRFGRRLLP